MFDIGWSEMLVIALAAIIVIGPKELPGVLRTLGRFVRKAQNMASEFRSHVDDMVRESDLHEVRDQVQRLSHVNLDEEMKKAVDPAGDLEKAFDMSDVEAKPAITTAPPAGAPDQLNPPDTTTKIP